MDDVLHCSESRGLRTLSQEETALQGPTDARAARMDVLLQQYCQWEGDLRRALQQKGFWSDSIDPRTGRAMHGTAGAVYSECVGAQVRPFGIH